MRELTMSEMARVSGATKTCTPETGVNDFSGIVDTKSFGTQVIELYEGAVQAASHIIERVANAF